MNVIQEMARYGTPEQKAAAADWEKHRGPSIGVFERIRAELCDDNSEISREFRRAEAERARAWLAYVRGPAC